MGRRSLRPLRTKNGKTNCPTCNCVSLTNFRKAGDWRKRRGRYAGNCPTGYMLINAFYVRPANFKVQSEEVAVDKDDPAPIRREEAEEHAHERRLATAIRAEDRRALARADYEDS